jgi:hypothetical protein
LSDVTSPPLLINRDVDYDWLIALPLGRVLDGQPANHRVELSADAAWILDGPAGETIGFAVQRLSEFDPDALDALWTGPRFAAPTLGLAEASAGKIAVASQARYATSSSLNRLFFDAAVASEGVGPCARGWRAWRPATRWRTTGSAIRSSNSAATARRTPTCASTPS